MNRSGTQRICQNTAPLVAVAAALLAWCATLTAATGDSPFPVRISSNGRHFVNSAGKPFLLHGDTAWSLILQLTTEEAGVYLENRRQKGFNAIIVSLTDVKYADNPPRNRAGDAPFTTPGDFSTPNEAYFAHADAVLRRAAEKGMLVVLNPCYTGWGQPGTPKVDGWIEAILANGPAGCRNYGRYLGKRYGGFSNLIWQAGGDQTPKPGSALERNWLEILLGIKEHAPSHLWTAHWDRATTARDQMAFAPHLTIDNIYTGGRTYIQALRAYNRTNPAPIFLNEAHYEGFGVTAYSKPADETPQMMRAQAYWALLSGATGHYFGSHHVWHFGWQGIYPQYRSGHWREGMESQGSREMVFVKRLFEARAWHELVPDQDHSVVTNGYGTFGKDDRVSGGDYVTAARTGDGKLVMAYVPSTGTKPRSITVDMARLSGPASARWYNPTSGTFTEINGPPLANSGSRDVTTPGDNGTGANDWVLVIEAMNPPTRAATHTNLRAGELSAVIGGNAPHEQHHAGYNGVWSLRHAKGARSIFVPAVAGLNLEHIVTGEHLEDSKTFFEPRHAPMTLTRLSDTEAELHQPPTPTFHVESWTRFKLIAPHYLDMEFRCRAHRDVFPRGYLSLFWASYMNAPADKSLYFLVGLDAQKDLWTQFSTQWHNDQSTVRHRQDTFEMTFPEGGRDALFKSLSRLRFDRPFFYGHFDDLVWIVMFDRAEGIRFTHSPSGGGANAELKTGNPAWDFQFLIPRPELMKDYSFKVRTVLRPKCSREDILAEFNRWNPRP